MNESKFERFLEIIKFIFDLVRTPFFLALWVIKLTIATFGVGLGADLIYKAYKIYSSLNIKIAGSILFFIAAFFVITLAGYAIFYAVKFLWGIIFLAEIPFTYDNDIVVNIECFFEDIPYYLFQSKRDEQAKFLGFENMAEFEEFSKTHSELYKQYSIEDIESFRKERMK